MKTITSTALSCSLVVVNLITEGLQILHPVEKGTGSIFTARIVVINKEAPVARIRHSLSQLLLVFSAILLPSTLVRL